MLIHWHYLQTRSNKTALYIYNNSVIKLALNQFETFFTPQNLTVEGSQKKIMCMEGKISLMVTPLLRAATGLIQIPDLRSCPIAYD